MKAKLMALLLLAGSSAFAAHISIGVGIGVGGYYPGGYYVAAAPPPPPVAYYAPPPVYPRVGYTWVPGYYYPAGPRWAWRAGYWARPPYAHAVWVGPRYGHGRYYRGHWRR